MRVIQALVLSFLLAGCGNRDVMDDLSTEVASTHTVTNGSITLELRFMGNLNLDGQYEPWSETRQKPYINAANKWLQVLTGIEDRSDYHFSMEIHVQPLDGGNGMGGPIEESCTPHYCFTVHGGLVVGSHTYESGFDPVEFNANIVHEMGHVFGVGSLTEKYTVYDQEYKGMVFRKEGSIAVKKYNQLYGTNFKYLPMSDDRGHLYDYRHQEDKKRILDNGTEVPPMTQEVMSNGYALGVISVALLDDIGYVVDYSKVEPYSPKQIEVEPKD